MVGLLAPSGNGRIGMENYKPNEDCRPLMVDMTSPVYIPGGD